MDRTILTSKDMRMIIAGLRSLDSVSGSKYYSQLMEKIQAGSAGVLSGSESMLIDLSSWHKDSLPTKIEIIQKSDRGENSDSVSVLFTWRRRYQGGGTIFFDF